MWEPLLGSPTGMGTVLVSAGKGPGNVSQGMCPMTAQPFPCSVPSAQPRLFLALFP